MAAFKVSYQRNESARENELLELRQREQPLGTLTWPIPLVLPP